MPEQEEPQDEFEKQHGIIEEETDGEEEVGGTFFASLVTAAAFVGLMVFIGWGIVTAKPYVENWIEDSKTPDIEDEVLVCEQPEVEDFCSGFADHAVSVALDSCPSQPVAACPVPWKPHEDAGPEAVHEYLIFADQLIDDMESAAAVIESMNAIMRQFGNTDGLQRQAFNDKSWLILLGDMDSRVDKVRRDLWDNWPPPPYNSDNPLLDAHTRLLMAYVALDRARDYVWLGIRDARAYYVTGYTDAPIADMRQQIDTAQQFGLRAMR